MCLHSNQQSWPASPPPLASWHMHGSLHWWAWGPPTTAAQDLAELLSTTCGCGYVITVVARFKSSLDRAGGRLAGLQTWQFGADGQRPRRRLVQHSRAVNHPTGPDSLCWGASSYCFLLRGSSIESKPSAPSSRLEQRPCWLM